MNLDPKTVQAVADALVADMATEDYCIGAKKVRLLLRSLGATVGGCQQCGDEAAGDYCDWCDPNRPPRRAIPNAARVISDAWADVLQESMKKPYDSSWIAEHLK